MKNLLLKLKVFDIGHRCIKLLLESFKRSCGYRAAFHQCGFSSDFIFECVLVCSGTFDSCWQLSQFRLGKFKVCNQVLEICFGSSKGNLRFIIDESCHRLIFTYPISLQDKNLFDHEQIALVEAYSREQGMFLTEESKDATYTDVIEMDLGEIVPSLAGPRRPQDRVALADMAPEFAKVKAEVLANLGREDVADSSVAIERDGETFEVGHGAVVIAAITSCTNTSNPNVMMAAGLLAKKAVERRGEGAEGLNQEQFGNLLASIDRKSSPDGLSHERGVVVAVEVKGAGAETAEETSTASSASAGARRSGSTAEGSETCFAPFFFCSCMGQSDDTADDDSYLHPESQAAT